jgi:hypothetical protein
MQKETQKETKSEKFIEGVDFYFENGLMILTAHFLLKRGYCCGNGCRNCPYSKADSPAS